MKFNQLESILKIRLGREEVGLQLGAANLLGSDCLSLLSVDKAIFRKKLPSGKYTYLVLNAKDLDYAKSGKFPASHITVLAYEHTISRIYGGKALPPEDFVLTGLDLAVDVNVQAISPQLGFSFAFFQRLLIGAYSSSSKTIIMSLDAFSRFVLKNNPLSKGVQAVFYELYSVLDNKFIIQAEVPTGPLLLEIQRRGQRSSSGIPTDFYFGKERLRRSRVSSASFSFDLDIYDKGLKEQEGAYDGITRFELRFRGCEHDLSGVSGLLCNNPVMDVKRKGLVEQVFLGFLNRAILLRSRPKRRISKTSFSNVYKWPEDSWWSKVKDYLLGYRVVHLDTLPRG